MRGPLVRRRAFLAALLAGSMLGATGARADATAPQQQFDWGLAEMMAGRYATGCPALAESYRLDPLPGALFTLAECEAKWGKISSAVTHYEAYLDLFSRMTAEQQLKQRGRDKLALAEKEKLAPEVPLLTMVVGASVPAGAAIQRDGETVGAPSRGVATPVDPGEHLVLLLVPGRPARETRVSLARGEKKTVFVEYPPDGAPSSAYRTWAWVSAGVGAAGLATGTVLGLLALGKKSTVDHGCNTGTDVCATAEGLQAANALQAYATASTVGFTVGLLAIAGSAALFLLRPGTSADSKRVSLLFGGEPRGGYVGFARAF